VHWLISSSNAKLLLHSCIVVLTPSPEAFVNSRRTRSLSQREQLEARHTFGVGSDHELHVASDGTRAVSSHATSTSQRMRGVVLHKKQLRSRTFVIHIECMSRIAVQNFVLETKQSFHIDQQHKATRPWPLNSIPKGVVHKKIQISRHISVTPGRTGCS
jgi:hypothetical protein